MRAFLDDVVQCTLNMASIALAAFDAVGMSGAGVMRVKKLKGGGIITVAARHNKREIQAEMGATGSIDPIRSRLNYTIAGPAAAADVGQLAKNLMTAAGVVKLRKDAVMALEIVFSLPPGHAIDDRAYFTDCATWAEHHFGGVILSVDVHKDEAQDHCHVLLLPLVKGRMAGSDMLGGKQMLLAMHKQFHLDVAGRHGLSKAPARLTGASKQAAVKAVLQKLRETGDSAFQSVAWATIRGMIENDPMQFVMALGIELKAPKKKLRTMDVIFTSKGKGSTKEANPIGFTPPEKEQTLCSVGFALKAPSPQATTAPPTARKPAPAPTLPTLPIIDSEAIVQAEARVRDIDLDPALYDLKTGEYFQRPPPLARNQRHAADAWVAAALMTV